VRGKRQSLLGLTGGERVKAAVAKEKTRGVVGRTEHNTQIATRGDRFYTRTLVKKRGGSSAAPQQGETNPRNSGCKRKRPYNKGVKAQNEKVKKQSGRKTGGKQTQKNMEDRKLSVVTRQRKRDEQRPSVTIRKGGKELKTVQDPPQEIPWDEQ